MPALLLFAPIPTGEPVSTVAIIVVSAIVSLFGLFRGGVSRQVKAALEGLRSSLTTVADTLMRFAWRIANALGRAIQTLGALWVRVIQPMLEHLARIARRINQIVDRILRPYLDLLRRINETILLIYETIFRPIILTIETLRRMLLILKVMRLGFAQRLDWRLARLEGKIAAPILALLGKVNELGGWVNFLLTVQLTLNQAVLLNSLYAYQGSWVSLFWNAQSEPLTPAERIRLQAQYVPSSPAESLSQLEEYFATGGGPLAPSINEAVATLRREWGL